MDELAVRQELVGRMISWIDTCVVSVIPSPTPMSIVEALPV